MDCLQNPLADYALNRRSLVPTSPKNKLYSGLQSGAHAVNDGRIDEHPYARRHNVASQNMIKLKPSSIYLSICAFRI